MRSSALIVVVSELRATTTRAVALAGIAALAVYGSVAIGGARDDLIRGLDTNFGEYLQTADLWVTTGGNDLDHQLLRARDRASTALPMRRASHPCATTRAASWMSADRRMWVIGRPAADDPLIPPSQLAARRSRTRRRTHARRRHGATISNAFAGERHLRVGVRFQLPTPSGQASFAVAAITTNLGWAPGAVILDVRRLSAATGARSDPTALEVSLRKGVTPEDGQGAGAEGARAPAGPEGPDVRRTSAASTPRTLARDCRRSAQIATLLLIAAALAVASALSAAHLAAPGSPRLAEDPGL